MSDNRKIVFETPLHSAETSSGRTKYWIGRVYDANGVISTDTEYWQAGHVHQFSAPTYPIGKQGRNDREQGISEIEGDAKKKVNKGYVAAGVESAEWRPPILPMLAHGFDDRGKNLLFPCFAQLKQNGFRAMYDGVDFWTRGGKKYPQDVINHLSINVANGIILDGELVLPEPYTFQDSAAALKKYRPGISNLIEFRVYDCYDQSRPELTFYDRFTLLRSMLVKEAIHGQQQVYLVETILCDEQTDLSEVHQRYTLAGHEGTIARNIKGVYKHGHRSADLLKIKDMQDAEYEIVGFSEGQGKDAGTVIFTCKAPNGQTFTVRPKGTDAYRRELFLEGAANIGKELKVQYQALTDGGLPQFPVGLAVL